MKIVRKVALYLFLLLATLCVGLLLFINVYNFKVDQKKVSQKLSDSTNPPAQYDTLHFPGLDYPLTKLDNLVDSDTIVLFMHGSPGNVRDFLSFYEKDYGLEDFRLIALERPGYSSASFGNLPVELEEQVAPLAAYLQTFSPEKDIFLVSHSYGGAPAGLLAAKYPGLVDGLLLGAVLIDPENEPVWWFNRMLESPLFHWILPDFFSMANKEKMAHAEELKKIEPIWMTIECPVYFLHGSSDRIAPVANITFARQVFSEKNNIHFEIIEDMGHLIQIQEQGRIAKGIKWLSSHPMPSVEEKQ